MERSHIPPHHHLPQRIPQQAPAVSIRRWVLASQRLPLGHRVSVYSERGGGLAAVHHAESDHAGHPGAFVRPQPQLSCAERRLFRIPKGQGSVWQESQGAGPEVRQLGWVNMYTVAVNEESISLFWQCSCPSMVLYCTVLYSSFGCGCSGCAISD